MVNEQWTERMFIYTCSYTVVKLGAVAAVSRRWSEKVAKKNTHTQYNSGNFWIGWLMSGQQLFIHSYLNPRQRKANTWKLNVSYAEKKKKRRPNEWKTKGKKRNRIETEKHKVSGARNNNEKNQEKKIWNESKEKRKKILCKKRHIFWEIERKKKNVNG